MVLGSFHEAVMGGAVVREINGICGFNWRLLGTILCEKASWCTIMAYQDQTVLRYPMLDFLLTTMPLLSVLMLSRTITPFKSISFVIFWVSSPVRSS